MKSERDRGSAERWAPTSMRRSQPEASRRRRVGVLIVARSVGVALIFGWFNVPRLAMAESGLVDVVAPPDSMPWIELEPGLELGEFASPVPVTVGDATIRILRIDPARFELLLLNVSVDAERTPLTARDWCLEQGLVAAVNASMYQEDYRTSVSFMRTRDHVNNPRISKDKTFLCFDRLVEDVPVVAILDRQCDDIDALLPKYGTYVQSIRMLSCHGVNVWRQREQRWSTAAIGIDQRGAILFVHARSLFTTHDLIEALRQLPLYLDRLMYTEGGFQAQLFVAAGGQSYEFVGMAGGSGNTGVETTVAWPIPNVIGVARRSERLTR